MHISLFIIAFILLVGKLRHFQKKIIIKDIEIELITSYHCPPLISKRFFQRGIVIPALWRLSRRIVNLRLAWATQ
jgi:hypothetical protein